MSARCCNTALHPGIASGTSEQPDRAFNGRSSVRGRAARRFIREHGRPLSLEPSLASLRASGRNQIAPEWHRAGCRRGCHAPHPLQ
jgi:hypothetical protein